MSGVRLHRDLQLRDDAMSDGKLHGTPALDQIGADIERSGCGSFLVWLFMVVGSFFAFWEKRKKP
jgi:hypothetical protein